MLTGEWRLNRKRKDGSKKRWHVYSLLGGRIGDDKSWRSCRGMFLAKLHNRCGRSASSKEEWNWILTARRNGRKLKIQPKKKNQIWKVENDKDKSKGKGRRFCLGIRIYSIPCRTSYFVPGRSILKNRMNSSFSSNDPGAIHPILQIALVHNS